MASYTITILGVCPGGNHIKCQLKRDGANLQQFEVLKEEILNATPPDRGDITDLACWLMRNAALKAGATTAAQAKTAIEAATWVL